MTENRVIICAVYGADRYRESILRELGNSGIEANVLSSGNLTESEIPAWVSNRGAGATDYISVSEPEREAAAKLIAGLNRICQACGAYFSEKIGRCPVCNELWAKPAAE
jgi:hypothetical protein